jgi:hypothetical protein
MDSLYTEVGQKESPKTPRSRKQVAQKMLEFEQAKTTLSQRQWSERNGVARTTLQYWLKRKDLLEESSVVKDFFEHPDGVAWLHRVVVAAHFVFTDLGCASIHNVAQFLELSGVGQFVASSYASQQKVATALDQAICEFAKVETERLSQQMPSKKITLCEDETFHPEICLVAMEPRSNYIVLESYAPQRDGATWSREVEQALVGMPVEVIQSSSDEGKGLLNHVRTGLFAHHSPDTFHVVQEIVKGTSVALASQTKKRQQAYEQALDQVKPKGTESPESLAEGAASELEKPEDKAKKQKEEALQELKIAESRKERMQASVRDIGRSYHPYDLDTGVAKRNEEVGVELDRHFDEIRQIAQEAGLSDTCKKHIDKAYRVVAQMVATIAFFFYLITQYVEELGVSEELEKALYEQLIAGFYLKQVAGKEKDKMRRFHLEQNSQQLLSSFRQREGPFKDLDEGELQRLECTARECAGVFQRSSSCVEGRNAQLSLRHHGLHRLSRRKLQALTAVHNYFLKRGDGTTAAERFFEAKPRDLFQWVLDHVELPARPRWKLSKLFSQPLLKVA